MYKCRTSYFWKYA